MIVPVMTIVGDSDEERHDERELVRASMSFYGSTPNYAFIWDEAGFEGTTARIREKQKAGDFKGMATQITDEHIAAFATESTWDGLADALIEKYRESQVASSCTTPSATTIVSSDMAPSRDAYLSRDALATTALRVTRSARSSTWLALGYARKPLELSRIRALSSRFSQQVKASRLDITGDISCRGRGEMGGGGGEEGRAPAGVADFYDIAGDRGRRTIWRCRR